jgi:hypothetical protein
MSPLEGIRKRSFLYVGSLDNPLIPNILLKSIPDTILSCGKYSDSYVEITLCDYYSLARIKIFDLDCPQLENYLDTLYVPGPNHLQIAVLNALSKCFTFEKSKCKSYNKGNIVTNSYIYEFIIKLDDSIIKHTSFDKEEIFKWIEEYPFSIYVKTE